MHIVLGPIENKFIIYIYVAVSSSYMVIDPLYIGDTAGLSEMLREHIRIGYT